MRIIVVGGSRFGVATVRELLDCKHDVVLVDQDSDRLEELSHTLDCGFIEGDGTLPQVLRDAYGDGADALLLMTNHDDVNILGGVVGKSIGFGRIILQIVRSELLDITEELGFQDVITPHFTVARSVVRSLETHSDVAADLKVHKGLRIGVYQVAASHAGQTIASLDLPPGSRAIARLDDEDIADLDDDRELCEGDKVMIAAMRKAQDEIDALFTEEN